jgi:hypothetical protein
MFFALRRLAIPFIVGYSVILRRPVSSSDGITVAFITVGAIVAAFNDLTADYLGYMFVIMNNILTSLYFNMSKDVAD